jgi:activator of HSP90 ATPase
VGLDWDFVIKLSKRMNELTDDGALAFYLTTDVVIKTKKTETKNKEVRITKKIKDWAETAALRKELYLEENK